jgi:small GTP-binding protein
MSNKKYINFGLAGSVSVGKSTILNALLYEYLGETKLKRTTYVPFKFINVNGKKHDVNHIKNEIMEVNKNNGNEIKLKEFEMDFKWNTNSLYNCTIIDFPGVNDPHEVDNKMESILYDNLVNLDYLIYVIDSNMSLNNKSERNFIKELFTKIKNCDTLTNLIILFNKYDEHDEEVDELIDEAKEFIFNSSKEIGLENIPNIYEISGMKLMIKNIISKSANYTNIPKNIYEKVVIGYFGKHEKNKMMSYEYKEIKNKIEEIPFTEIENKFMDTFYESFNDLLFYDMKKNHTNNKLKLEVKNNVNNNFKIYLDKFYYYINQNNILTNDDIILMFIDIVDYYYDNNVNEFTKDKNFVKNIFEFVKNEVMTNQIFSEKIEELIFHNFKKIIEKINKLDNVLNQNLVEIINFVDNKNDNLEYICFISDKLISTLINFLEKSYVKNQTDVLKNNVKNQTDVFKNDVKNNFLEKSYVKNQTDVFKNDVKNKLGNILDVLKNILYNFSELAIKNIFCAIITGLILGVFVLFLLHYFLYFKILWLTILFVISLFMTNGDKSVMDKSFENKTTEILVNFFVKNYDKVILYSKVEFNVYLYHLINEYDKNLFKHICEMYNYGYMIYIDYIYFMKNKYKNTDFMKLKYNFKSVKNINKPDEYEQFLNIFIVNAIDKLNTNTNLNLILENVDITLINYYPTEIITLYNLYSDINKNNDDCLSDSSDSN